MQVQVLLLGPVAVADASGGITEVSAAQEQILLTALATARAEPISSGRLIDLIWGDSPPQSASGSLKTLVHRLRRQHGRQVITTTQTGYRLGHDVASDYARVVGLSAVAADATARGDGAAAVRHLSEAAGLFRGDPPTPLTSTTAGLHLHRMLEALRHQVRDGLLEARLASGEGESLIVELEAAVAADPLAEANWERLMVALYRSGRQAAALGAFQRARAALVGNAGLEPGPSLRATERRIIDHDLDLVRIDSPTPDPASRSSASVATNGSDSSTAPTAARSTIAWYDGTIGLVGRRGELDRIMQSITADRSNPRRRLVLIDGDAGIGKTRMAGEAAKRAEARGIRVLYGQCDPESDAPYRPYSRAVDSLLRNDPNALDDCPPGTAARLVRFSPRFADLVTDEPGTDRIGGHDAIDREDAAFSDLLESLAAPTGLLLIVDDIHWATPASMTLLRRLAAEDRPSNVTILATYRPRDIPNDSSAHLNLAALYRLPSTTAVHLDGFAFDDIRSFIVAVSDQAEIPDAVTDWMETATSGVPYLIGAVLRHLADTSKVVRRDGLWRLADGELDQVPTGIRHLITGRIAALPDAARRLLSVAAVAGLEFDADAVAGAAGLDEDRASDALESAALAGLLREDDVGHWRWEHDLARSVVSDEISLTRRARTHWNMAVALSTRHLPDHASIAHHTIEGIHAAEPRDAARLLADAAEDALAHDAETASRYAEVAVRNLPAGRADPLRARLLVIKAVAAGELPGGPHTTIVQQAEQAAIAAEDPGLIVRAITLDDRVPAHWRYVTRSAEHLAATRAALAALPTDDVDHRALILSHMLGFLHYTARGPERSRITEQLCSILQGDDLSPSVRRRVNRLVHLNLPVTDNSDDHLMVLRAAAGRSDAEVFSDTEHDPVEEMINAVTDAAVRGDFGLCDGIFEQLIVASDDRNGSLRLDVLRWLAKVRSAQGDVDGLRDVRARLEAFTTTATTSFLHTVLTRDVSVGISILTGTTPDGSVGLDRASDGSDLFAPLHTALGIGEAWIAAECGEDDAARAMLATIIRNDSGLGGTIESTALYSDLLCRYRPRLAPTSGAADVLSDYAGQWLFSVGFCIGPVDFYLAQLVHAAGEDPTAHLERALASADAGGAAFWAERIAAFDEAR